jgi:translation initiation factor IF-3
MPTSSQLTLPNHRNRTRITQAPKIKGAPDRPPQDLEIRSKYIAYVDREGMFNPRVWRDDVLKMLDPRSEHLVQVESADPDDPRSLPKCKIVSKSYIREKAKAAQDSAKERSKAERSGKIVELNWAIAPGDLEMKLNKVCTFLEEGRKVDVMIAPKKRKRVANKEEMEEVLRRMIESVETVEGVTQIATPEGNVGGTMVYYFEKRK